MAFWFLLYNIIFYPALVFIYLIISFTNKKVREGFYGKMRSKRLICELFKIKNVNSEIFWFHAASLGEFQQVKPVIENFKKKNAGEYYFSKLFLPIWV